MKEGMEYYLFLAILSQYWYRGSSLNFFDLTVVD